MVVHLSDKEAQLIVRAAHDPEAFSQLYDKYFPKIYNYIFFRVGNQHIADDLTSIVFEKMLVKIQSYQVDKGKFSTWLFTIAKNSVTDFFRDQKKQQSIEGNLLNELSFQMIDIEKTILNNEANAHLLKAIERLNDRERQIIGLKFWGGFKNRQISVLVDETENNVAVVLHRAIKRLKMYLEE